MLYKQDLIGYNDDAKIEFFTFMLNEQAGILYSTVVRSSVIHNDLDKTKESLKSNSSKKILNNKKDEFVRWNEKFTINVIEKSTLAKTTKQSYKSTIRQLWKIKQEDTYIMNMVSKPWIFLRTINDKRSLGMLVSIFKYMSLYEMKKCFERDFLYIRKQYKYTYLNIPINKTCEMPKKIDRKHFLERFHSGETDRKVSEQQLKKWLEESYTIIYNNIISDGNKYVFPDFLIDCKTHYIIIECDEHGHKNKIYSEEREREREQFICKTLEKPCAIIRYNPNSQYSKEVTLETLKMHIDMYTHNKIQATLVVMLFYE